MASFNHSRDVESDDDLFDQFMTAMAEYAKAKQTWRNMRAADRENLEDSYTPATDQAEEYALSQYQGVGKCLRALIRDEMRRMAQSTTQKDVHILTIEKGLAP